MTPPRTRRSCGHSGITAFPRSACARTTACSGAAALGVETVGGQAALHGEVGNNDGAPIGAVYRYQLWLDQETGFPVKVLSYGKDGKLIESVEMEGLQINPEFSDGFFDQ